MKQDRFRASGVRRLTRRETLVGTAAATLAAVLALRTGPRGANAQTKQPKARVAYKNEPNGEMRCGNCIHYQAENACELVEGEISPNGWCQLWTAKQQ